MPRVKRFWEETPGGYWPREPQTGVCGGESQTVAPRPRLTCPGASLIQWAGLVPARARRRRYRSRFAAVHTRGESGWGE